jgi:hypothetical protein
MSAKRGRSTHVLFLILLLTAALGGLLAARRWVPARSPATWVAQLPDGTILRLEAVTYGKQHDFEPESSLWSSLRRILPIFPGRADFSRGTDRDSLLCWVSRRDRASGKYLNLGSWGQTVALDEHGCRIAASEPQVLAGDTCASWCAAGKPPPLAPPKYRFIVGLAELQPFPRRRRAFKLRFDDVNGRPLAEFTVPNPAPGPHPRWTPSPLPITKRDGDLSVTLTRLVRGEEAWMNPTFLFRQNGKLTSEWETGEVTFSDATGNSAERWRCTLCPYEPAWKLQTKLFRTARARFAPNELWTVRGVPVPKPGTASRLSGTGTLGGTTLDLLAIAAAGTVSYSNGVPTAQASPGPGQLAGTRGGSMSSSSTTVNGVTREQLTVTMGLPHVAVAVPGITADHRLTLRAVDDRGRQIISESGQGSFNKLFLSLDIPPGSKSLDLTFAIHTCRRVEFVVKPPRPKERHTRR